MKQKNSIRLCIVLFLLTCTATISSQEIGREQNIYVYNFYPLYENAVWKYDVYENSIIKGSLEIQVIEKEKVSYTRHSYSYSVPVFTLRFNDTFKNKTYTKKILSTYSQFVYTGSLRNLTPFLPYTLTIGSRFGDYLVVDIEKTVFLNSSRNTAVVRSLTTDSVEKYMSDIGLYYYKKGNIEYKLAETNVLKLKEKQGWRTEE